MNHNPNQPTEAGQRVWESLHANVRLLLEDPHAGLSPNSYMATYTTIYNHCTVRQQQANQSQGACVMGGDLYYNLQDLVNAHMHNLGEKCRDLMDVDLLVFYTREWDKFTQSAKFIDHLFSYLNRHWVKREVDEHHHGVYRIHTMALLSWKNTFFQQINEALIKAILRQIEVERNGETIDASMLKSVIDSLVALDVPMTDYYEPNPAVPRQSLYRSAFETQFFTATSNFYKTESEKFLSENSVPEYMKKAEARLNEEVQRVERYLHPTTQTPLVTLCETRLVEDHQEVFKEEFQNLLDADKSDDMQRMYKLLSRRAVLLEPLRSKLELHVRKVGLIGVAKVATDSDESQLDAKVYVDALLEVHKKYAALVNEAFHNDPGFVASLDKACREYVNRNQVCKTSTSKSPELLARYCDSLLKKSAKNPEEAELEEVLNAIMIVFKYIEDRDVFQKFYSKMLAKRLVGQSSASEDAEALMIAKLKDACGFDYTSKLQRMFTDVGLSKELNDQFRQQMEQNHDMSDMVDFSIMVLSTASWPFTGPGTEFNLPEELTTTYDRFSKYYTSKHSGRKLTWLFNQSKGEVRALFSKAKIAYAFQVNMYQMGILLQFNNATSHTIEVLQELTKLDQSVLAGNLSIFVKAKIMHQEPAEAAAGAPGTKYSLNLEYRNKKVRINLNVPIKSEQKMESDETHKTVEEDRKLLIQAAIVRIMKTRKAMKHVALMQEVIEQLQARFKPRVQDIKKCIEILLEKEYIERVEGEKDMFSYVA